MSDASINKEDLEIKKLKHEIKNLKADLKAKRHATWRWTITAASIVAATFLTVIQIQGAYNEIKNKEKQLGLEAKARTEESKARAQEVLIRSHQIFVSEILERVNGIKGLSCIPSNGIGRDCGVEGYSIAEYDMHPQTSQEASFRLAVNLMDEFDELCNAGLPLLTKQAKFGDHLKNYLAESICYKANSPAED